MMAYEIKHGPDQKALKERAETPKLYSCLRPVNSHHKWLREARRATPR